jgi:predicted transcriptional regulator
MNIDRKWVGKNQKKILGALLEKSCTKLEISDVTGINTCIVTNALYAMMEKGLVLRDGNRFFVTQ